MARYHNLAIPDIEKKLHTSSKRGLADVEAKKRLLEFGPNELEEKEQINPFAIFIRQFSDFIIWVLVAAAAVSGILNEWVDAIAIIVIVVLNAFLGFFQEYRAEKSLAALKKLSSPTSKVIRSGQHLAINSSDLVQGDLIELDAGDNIPADARLSYISLNFKTSEASLTGESTPVDKTILDLKGEAVPLAERTNMVYMGTSVAAGRGRAIICRTGMHTELGRIAGMIQNIKKELTPLQKRLESFGKFIVYACFILVAIIFLMEFWRGGEILPIFLTAVSLAVAAIPEGLPAVVTISLALGVSRLVSRHVLIRKLPSVETLGSTTVICSDKTGTLTKNEMTVQEVYSDDEIKALNCGVLCNGAQLVSGKIVGDPTEGAILVYAEKKGISKGALELEYPFVAEIPFDPVRKRMTIIRREGGKYIAFVKGAPDMLVDICALDAQAKAKILNANIDFANNAMRVLGVAYKTFDVLPTMNEAEIVERDLEFLGLIAMIDPPRPEVKAAIKECRTAGISTIMITGDHKNTAVAIGRELGITEVYARVSPEDKLNIIRDLHKRGEIVAMTGDGVNDAPALKESDIGIAMGITSTDVTKEVADMVITDDNFASIVTAVKEGRGIFDNIKKFIHYLLSCNIGEIMVMFCASLIGWPIPLIPIQILWVNIVTDGLPALALGVDPLLPDVMQKPPRPRDEGVITKELGILMLIQGAIIALCSLSAFAFVLFIEKEGLGRARTCAFMVLAISQLFHSFNCRSNKLSVFKLGIFSNMNLIYAFIVSLSLQVSIIYMPFFQSVFKTEYLGLNDWGLVILISSMPLWVMELYKLAINSPPSPSLRKRGGIENNNAQKIR
ncbi:cation-translocating P-type ATPase [Candidatus Saganbacteria bacterium]|nr:cation-translocating P-type ATPase [Candidatus Saganbacteria bacterium]